MSSNKGQALLEFILILPVLLLLLLSVVDIGRILYEKNHLENVLNDVVIMYYDDKNIPEIRSFINEEYNQKVTLEFDTDDNKVMLNSSIDIITPGLNVILGNPYMVEVSRVIINE